MRIGIYGGSFNPIHMGHLILAESAVEDYKLDRIYFITSYISPHKKVKEMLGFEERSELVRAAIEGNPRFYHSDIEKVIGGTSYSLKTIEHFVQLHKDAELFFFVGADQLVVFDKWFSYEKILEMCNVIAVNRANMCLDAVNKKIDEIKKNTGYQIGQLTIPDIEISSTDLRDRIYSGRTIRYRVPYKVCDIIDRKNYYK